MAQWIVVDGKRYEAVPLERLTLLQVAQAAKETGMTPERMEQVMRKTAEGLDDEVDQLRASAIMVWAARVAAGERHPTIESAMVPLERLDWITEEGEEEESADPPIPPTPTPPGSDSGEDAVVQPPLPFD